MIYELGSRHIENPSFLVIVSIDFERNLLFFLVCVSVPNNDCFSLTSRKCNI